MNSRAMLSVAEPNVISSSLGGLRLAAGHESLSKCIIDICEAQVNDDIDIHTSVICLRDHVFVYSLTYIDSHL